MFDTLSKGMRCVFRNKLRSFLTILGIAVGVTSVVLVSSIGEIGTAAIDSELSEMGMDSLVISASELNENDLQTVKAVSNVSDAMPLMNKVTTVSMHNKTVSAMVWGVNEDADKVVNLEIKYGRLLNRGDIAQKNHVCVIDEAIANDMYKRGNITGKTIEVLINGNQAEFEIVGVVRSGVNTLQNMLGGFIPDFVYIPYSVMQDYTNSYKFDNITVKLNDKTDSENAAQVIENMLNVSKEKTGVKVENLLQQKEKMNNIMNIASVALSVVAGISLIVSGISIMTVMLVSVSERTREIGIKKSIGATTYAIMYEFLLESVLITLIGGVIGFVIGAGLSALLCFAVGLPAAVNVNTAISVLIISVATGVLFGVYPARKAAMLRPVDALRHE